MNPASLRRYAATAYGLLWDEPQSAVTVRPGPGLLCVLSQVDYRLTLRALVEEHPIAPEDTNIIADAFNIPSGVEPQITVRRVQQPVSRRMIDQHVVTWTWREARCT